MFSKCLTTYAHINTRLSLCPLTLLCFKQAEARFSLEKLGSGGATARDVPDQRSLFAFCAKPRLRYKQKAKHLTKSTVISYLMPLDFQLRSNVKNAL